MLERVRTAFTLGGDVRKPLGRQGMNARIRQKAYKSARQHQKQKAHPTGSRERKQTGQSHGQRCWISGKAGRKRCFYSYFAGRMKKTGRTHSWAGGRNGTAGRWGQNHLGRQCGVLTESWSFSEISSSDPLTHGTAWNQWFIGTYNALHKELEEWSCEAQRDSEMAAGFTS